MGFLFTSTTTITPAPLSVAQGGIGKNMVRPIPQAAVELIRKFEGCELTAYQDAGGIWTIGYGHTEGVTSGMVITQEQAEEFLREDLQDIAPEIINIVSATLNNNQYSALLSFVYNVGIGNFKESTLLKVIDTPNSDNETAIAAQFMRWDQDADGVVLAGLQARRRAEAALYFTV